MNQAQVVRTKFLYTELHSAWTLFQLAHMDSEEGHGATAKENLTKARSALKSAALFIDDLGPERVEAVRQDVDRLARAVDELEQSVIAH